MRKYRPHQRALLTLQILCFLICSGFSLLFLFYLDRFKTLMIISLCVFWIITLALIFLLLPLYFHRSEFYLSAEELCTHTCFIFSSRSHMKLSSVQYVSITRLPFSSLLGLNFVSVHGMGGSILLPFLSKDDSLEIIDTLTEKIRSRHS